MMIDGDTIAKNDSVKKGNRLIALTTVDNPFDPFDNFTVWFSYDMSNGYNSSGLLAKEAKTSDALTDEENLTEIELAIDRIIANDRTGIYKKIVRIE